VDKAGPNLRPLGSEQPETSWAICSGIQLAALLAVLLFPVAALHAAALRIERIVITVSDLDRTEAFYRDGLGFATVARKAVADPAIGRLLGISGPVDTLTMALGREQVEFIRFKEQGRSYPEASRSPDLWFQHFAVVVSDMDAAYARLQTVQFKPISDGGPQTLPKEDGGVKAFKFRDPDGHPLELLYFPAGQGREVWHSHDQGPVELGIDHTAISVSETLTSLYFYHGLLGMKAAYEVTNKGAAQDRLDGIESAQVRITGLRPRSPDGAGIELLDYRNAPRGRPSPNSRANDLWHAHIVMRVSELDRIVSALGRHKVRLVSPGIVPLADGRRAVEVADPDGHELVLEEQMKSTALHARKREPQ
jgi:catechol 2,3-dioxygenase-like lactoylglutathione lyase family enzyme